MKLILRPCLSCWPVPISDFGDAVIATAGMKRKKSVIVTFDRKFVAALKSLDLCIHSLE